MLATQKWRDLVVTEHAQSEKMRAAEPPQDHWRPYAQGFRADPRRTDDPLVNRLLEEVSSRHTVLDVGAGGGRLALPLALKCRQLVAVEPSASMAEVLRQQAADCSISNVSVVEEKWEDAEVELVDVVLCAHVLYVVADVEPFVRKMEAHAGERVLVVLYQAPPQSSVYPLWQRIHGEPRISLPSLPEFKEVLAQLNVDARIDMLPAQPARGFADQAQALEQLAGRLYLAPGSTQMAKLEEMLPGLLEELDGSLIIKGSHPMQPALVSWQPGR